LSVPEPVDIILLSYNRADYLAQMVAALERRTQAPYRLTIVDNASGAATRQWLRANAWRFHQIIWNERNEHLAGLDRGIRATESEIFVVSDADLVVGAPTSDGCWLTRLLSLAARHDDFGLIAVRLDSISAARNARLDSAPRIDGELLETPTGVWLNLIRRSALRVPYMSDGITCHALRRAGYRVGIAANIYATHLGDGDAERHPDYLARKQVASGWSTTYPRYPELADVPAPPTLEQVALAAPLLAALEAAGIDPADAASESPVALVDPQVGAIGPARAILAIEPDQAALERAFTLAGELVLVLAAIAPPPAPDGWQLIREEPGPHPILLRLARLASRPRWRARLLYSTVEHRANWIAVFRAGAFGDSTPLRIYAYRAEHPRAVERSAQRPEQRSGGLPRLRRRRVGELATKLRRLLRAEWALLRARGR
jgi:hypothetical protein